MYVCVSLFDCVYVTVSLCVRVCIYNNYINMYNHRTEP